MPSVIPTTAEHEFGRILLGDVGVPTPGIGTLDLRGRVHFVEGEADEARVQLLDIILDGIVDDTIGSQELRGG